MVYLSFTCLCKKRDIITLNGFSMTEIVTFMTVAIIKTIQVLNKLMNLIILLKYIILFWTPKNPKGILYSRSRNYSKLITILIFGNHEYEQKWITKYFSLCPVASISFTAITYFILTYVRILLLCVFKAQDKRWI